ncbi:hypothetical protein [Magnetospirillum sp. XM-1]|uniref:hypothetical protein n=1 Tax=Magnetospirillum sp. XM-1 TaxID=1663591 RepID=UPI0012E3F201|nr:hypothetical protein [Magnetospirillum sp. XM-1]
MVSRIRAWLRGFLGTREALEDLEALREGIDALSRSVEQGREPDRAPIETSLLEIQLMFFFFDPRGIGEHEDALAGFMDMATEGKPLDSFQQRALLRAGKLPGALVVPYLNDPSDVVRFEARRCLAALSSHEQLEARMQASAAVDAANDH